MIGLLHPLVAAGAGWLLLAPDPSVPPRCSAAERVGLGALAGIGLLTLLLAIVHLLFAVPLALPLLIVLDVLLVAAGLIVWAKRHGVRGSVPGGPASAEGLAEASAPILANPRARWPWPDLLLVLLLAALVGIGAWRASFYPVSAMDAHGYDGRARWIVAERALDLSIYDALAVSGRSNLSYPPLQPLASALVYWGGGAEGKIVDALVFAALLLAVGGFVTRHAGRTAGLLAAFLVVGAPEVWRHLSLGLTNIQAMAYLGAGLVLLAEGGAGPRIRRVTRADLLPALFLALAAGTRPEGVVAAPALALAARRPLVALPALVVFGAWQLVLGSWLDTSNAAALRTSGLPDPERLLRTATLLLRHLAEPGLLGWTMPLLAFVLTLSLVAGRREQRRGGAPRRARGRDRSDAGRAESSVRFPDSAGLFRRLLVLEGALLLGLLLLYQQIAPDFGGGGDSYLYNSLKRATFVLLPGAAVAVVLSPLALRLLDTREPPLRTRQ